MQREIMIECGSLQGTGLRTVMDCLRGLGSFSQELTLEKHVEERVVNQVPKAGGAVSKSLGPLHRPVSHTQHMDFVKYTQ